MYCSNCGEKRAEGKFCSSCGTEFTSKRKQDFSKVEEESSSPLATATTDLAQDSEKEESKFPKNMGSILTIIAVILLVIVVAVSSQNSQQAAAEKEEAQQQSEIQAANEAELESLSVERDACSSVNDIYSSLKDSASGKYRVDAAPLFTSAANQIRVAVSATVQVRSLGIQYADVLDQVASFLQLDTSSPALNGQLVQAKLDFDEACSNLQ